MPIDPRRIRAVCFDVDGTLSDTDDLWVASLSRVLRPLGFMFPRRDPRAFARWAIMAAESPANALYHLSDHAGIDNMLGRAASWISRRRPLLRPHKFWMIPGTRELVQTLQPRFPMGVISARDAGATNGFIDHFALRPYFGVVATALTCPHTKPFPDPVNWAAGKLGVPPENVLMVGDTVVDILAGRAAGAQTVGVLCGFGRENELRRAGADEILAYPAELLRLL